MSRPPRDPSAGPPLPTPPRVPTVGSSEQAAPRDRGRLIAPTVKAISDRFDGAVVALLTVDEAEGTASPIEVHDPDPAGGRDLARLVGASVPLAGTICGTVVATGRPAQVGTGAESLPEEALPDGWLHYAERHGIQVAIALPITHGMATPGVLVLARRVGGPFAPDVVAALAESAQRLAPLLASAGDTASTPPPAEHGEATPTHRYRRLEQAGDVLLGLVPATLAAALVGGDATPNTYRPVSALVLGVTALGLLRGVRAAVVAAVANLVVIWWFFTRPYRSFEIAGGKEAAGLLVAALTMGLLVLLIDRIDRARVRADAEAGITDALIRQLPIGFGVVDRDLRFRRVNQQLATIDGEPVAHHLGHRPGEVNPLIGELVEDLLQRVIHTGEPVVDHLVSFEMPDIGTEHHWRINQYPVRSEGKIIGAGMAIDDITEDTVIRHRAQLLLRLSRSITAASTVEQIAAEVTRVLAEGLGARTLFAYVRDDDVLDVVDQHGYATSDGDADWTSFAVPRDDRGRLATAVRASELVIGITSEDPTPEHLDEEAVRHRAAGDVTVAWQPVLLPGSADATAAIGVAWAYPRRLTEHSRTLLQTASSIAGLALSRIELTERTRRNQFRIAMDAMIDQVLLASAVRDETGEIVDFTCDFANAATLRSTGRRAEDLVGRRMRELYPRWAASGMFDRFRRVVETGQPWVADRVPYSDRATDGREVSGYWNVQVVKVDDGYIAASRDVTDLMAAEKLAEEARELAQRERIAVELLQRAALPAHLPRRDGVDLGAHYRPARRHQPVGGDWYDAFPLDDDQLALVIADVAGHGQEAAAYMVQVRNIFRAVATERLEPEPVLRGVDDVLQRVNDRGAPFVTCCYATLDTRTGALAWSSAGHPPPLLVRADGEDRFGTTEPGPPLATVPRSRYETASAQLAPADLLVLYTDGLVERRGEIIDRGLERLRTQVRDRPTTGSEDIARYLADLVHDPVDDIAVLCAQRSHQDRST